MRAPGADDARLRECLLAVFAPSGEGGQPWESTSRANAVAAQDVGAGPADIASLLTCGEAQQWAFVGPQEPWHSRGTGLAEVELTALEIHQARAPSADGTFRDHDEGDSLEAGLKRAMLRWGPGCEARELERFVRAGGVAVVAIRGAAFRHWQDKGTPPPMSMCSTPSSSSRPARPTFVDGGPGTLLGTMQVRLHSQALRRLLVSVLSEEMVLTDDVVLEGGRALRRGWQLLPNATAGPFSRADVLRLRLPAVVVFDTDPGIPIVQPPRERLEPGVVQLAVALAEAQAEAPPAPWPPTRGSRVRRRLEGDGALVSMAVAGDLGTVLFDDQVEEDGKLVSHEGWVVVRWDDGRAEPICVEGLRPADDTPDFAKRVLCRRGQQEAMRYHESLTEPPTQPRTEKVAKDCDEASPWSFLVAWGLDPASGSLRVHAPRQRARARTMPLRVLQRCAEIGGTALAALLVCRRTAAQPCCPWARGWMRRGGRVLVEPGALQEAGAKCLPLVVQCYRRQGRLQPLVPAEIISLTGRREVGVALPGDGMVLWVHGARVFPADAEGRAAY